MKKVVIILLLVLPFILIYFISITGRILEKYSHIYVESLTVEDLEGNDVTTLNYSEIRVGSSQKFNVVIGPELASNPDVTINCYNNEMCSYTYVDGVLEITGTKYGQTTFIITSVDRTNISCQFKIKVTDDVPTGLVFTQNEITIMPGKAHILTPPSFIPTTTKNEYKEIIWETSDAEVVEIVDHSTGTIKGKKEGDATITARSKFNNEIYATLTVHVSNQKLTDVYFDHYDTSAYRVSETTLNLYNITKFSQTFMNQFTEEERKSQFFYKLESTSNHIDATELSSGIIKTDNTQTVLIKVGIYMINNPEVQIDEITIVFEKK